MNDQQKTESKGGLFGLLENPRWRMLIAFLLAVVGWTVVTVGIQPGTDRTINNVPVDFSYESGRYTALGLSIVNDPSKTVSLKVYGNGSDIGGLGKEDFVVYPKYVGLKGAGAVNLSLGVKCIAQNVDTSNIKVNVHPADTEVNVVFDKVEEKAVPVRIKTENFAIAKGYALQKCQAVPGEVVLKGPIGELDKITEAVATVTSEEELAHTTTLTAPLNFVNAEGESVELVYVKPETTTVDVTLTVYKQAELPLVVSLINAPPGFDTSSLSYTLSQPTLQVAGPAAVIDSLHEVSIGAIDLSTFTLDKVYEMSINLPNGLVSLENVDTVTVNFQTSGLQTKTINLKPDSVHVVNMPEGYSLEVLSNRIRNVVLCGPTDALEGLTAESVVAQIDMDELNIVTGQQTIAVTIYVPADDRVFALGKYSVSCQIESQ